MRDPSSGESAGETQFAVTNHTRASTLGDRVHLAGTSQHRRTGLLRHRGLPAGSGLWINPCEAIHTFGMNFPIDVAFLDRRHRVVKIRQGLGPRRICVCWRAASVLELPAGTIAGSRTQRGDLLQIRGGHAGREASI